jgi:hypothetical protein
MRRRKEHPTVYRQLREFRFRLPAGRTDGLPLVFFDQRQFLEERSKVLPFCTSYRQRLVADCGRFRQTEGQLSRISRKLLILNKH